MGRQTVAGDSGRNEQDRRLAELPDGYVLFLLGEPLKPAVREWATSADGKAARRAFNAPAAT